MNKHKQFDCSLWVNRKSIIFIHDLEVKGMLLVTIKFCFELGMSIERRKGSNKVLSMLQCF